MLRVAAVSLFAVSCAHVPLELPAEKIAFGEMTGDSAAVSALQEELRGAFNVADGHEAPLTLHLKVLAHATYNQMENPLPSRLPWYQERRVDRLRVIFTLTRPDGTVEF